MDDKPVSNDMKRGSGFYQPDSTPTNETQVKAKFKNINIYSIISDNIKRWLLPSSSKKHESAPYLLKRTFHPTNQGVSIQQVAQKESISTNKICIKNDSWKQINYETHLESMFCYLKKSDSSAFDRSSQSSDSEINSSSHSSQDAVDPDDIRLDSLSPSSTDSMPDTFSIESDSIFVSEASAWDQLIAATRNGKPTNNHDKQLQDKSRSLLANLSNETVDGVKPEGSPRKRYKKMLSTLR